MKEASDRPEEATELRSLAEKRLRAIRAGARRDGTITSEQRLVHELQVHQIELEMQNEELRRARADLEAVLQRYTDLYDFAPVGYFTLDRTGAISQANLTGARLLGLERARLVRKRFARFVREADRPAFNAFLQNVLASKGTESCEVQLLRTDDRPQYVEIEASSAEDGQGCRVTVADVTERKRAEEERERLLASEQKRALAESAIKLRDDFISVAAHELKTPITSLRGFAQLMQKQLDRNGTVDRHHLSVAMARIDQQGKRLTKLSEQLLSLSRLRSGQMTLHREETSLSALLQMVTTDIRQSYPSRDIDVHDGEVDLTLHIDPLRLEQVLVNLIDNAIKFSPPESKIDIGLDAGDAGWVKIAVRDQGIGVAEDQRERIFERFYQAHPENHYGGMGIGLFISREIVEMHGGSITVEQPENGGSEFVLRLPITPRDGSPPTGSPLGQ